MGLFDLFKKNNQENKKETEKHETLDLNDVREIYFSIVEEGNAILEYFWEVKLVELDPDWEYANTVEYLYNEYLNPYEKAVASLLVAAGDLKKLSVKVNGSDLVVSATSPKEEWLEEIKKLKRIDEAYWHKKTLCLSGDRIAVGLIKQAFARCYLELSQIPENLSILGVKQYHNATYEGEMIPDIRSGVDTREDMCDIYSHREGETRRANGYGRCFFRDGSIFMDYDEGSVYEGEFVDDCFCGNHTFMNGDEFEGKWSNGRYYGHGMMRYANGDFYEGNWARGKHSGSGTMRYADGGYYEGEWSFGRYSGRGKRVWADGDYYEGLFAYGIREGHGKYVYADGGYYEGEWENGDFNGHGKRVWADGDYYEGEFKKDKREGHGKYVWPNGNYYEGEWADGSRNGQGKLCFADGGYYEGEWKNSKYEGYGKFVWSNGDVYEGEWDGKRNGQGTMRYANGDVYEGEWKDGKKDGQGIMRYADERIEEGLWENDEYKESGKEDDSAIKLCIIGAQNAGKTTLTAAFTHVAHNRIAGNPPGMDLLDVICVTSGAESRIYRNELSEADFEDEEWIQFHTENREYKLAYWPGYLQENDLIAVEMANCDGAIVVVDVSEGILDTTRKLIRLAKDVAVIPIAAVVFNKCDLVSDKDLIEIEQYEIMEELAAFDYADVPIFMVSAEEICDDPYNKYKGESENTLMELFSCLDKFDFKAAKSKIDDSYYPDSTETVCDHFTVDGYFLDKKEGGRGGNLGMIERGTFISGVTLVNGKMNPSVRFVGPSEYFKANVNLDKPIAVRQKQRIGFYEGEKLVATLKVRD